MSTPALSVAMSVYNGERHLALAIDSILAQTFGGFEFLILNDGSSDGSRAIIDDYAQRDPRIVAIHRENRGLIASLNELVERAQSPLIARMDADDISEPMRFERQLGFLAGNPAYGVVGSWTADIDEDGLPYRVHGLDHPTSHEDFLAAIGHGHLICHPSVIMRRELVRQVGGYHSAFRHCEDFDLWLRLAEVTCLCSLPERLVRYRHWPNQVSSRHAYAQQIGAAISLIAYDQRSRGLADPTENLSELPAIEDLDELFGRDGIGDTVRAHVAPTIVHSQTALSGAGFDLLLSFLRDGGRFEGQWRTVVRLLRFREPRRAAELALTLMRA